VSPLTPPPLDSGLFPGKVPTGFLLLLLGRCDPTVPLLLRLILAITALLIRRLGFGGFDVTAATAQILPGSSEQ
jgi:hypothetical protein